MFKRNMSDGTYVRENRAITANPRIANVEIGFVGRETMNASCI